VTEPVLPYVPSLSDRVTVNAHSTGYAGLSGVVIAIDRGEMTGEGVQYAVQLDKYRDHEWFKGRELDEEVACGK